MVIVILASWRLIIFLRLAGHHNLMDAVAEAAVIVVVVSAWPDVAAPEAGQVASSFCVWSRTRYGPDTALLVQEQD